MIKNFKQKSTHVSAEKKKKKKTYCVVGNTNFEHFFFLLCTYFFYRHSFRGFFKNEIILFIQYHFFFCWDSSLSSSDKESVSTGCGIMWHSQSDKVGYNLATWIKHWCTRVVLSETEETNKHLARYWCIYLDFISGRLIYSLRSRQNLSIICVWISSEVTKFSEWLMTKCL